MDHCLITHCCRVPALSQKVETAHSQKAQRPANLGHTAVEQRGPVLSKVEGKKTKTKKQNHPASSSSHLHTHVVGCACLH